VTRRRRPYGRRTRLLSGDLTLEDLPASGRLSGGKGAAIMAAWPQVLTWRSMIRLRKDLPLAAGRWPLAAGPVGTPAKPLPVPGEVIARLRPWGAPSPESLATAVAYGAK